MKNSRFIVGIDLGTTTTSLSYIDTLSDTSSPKTLPIVQWEQESKVIEDHILPSFCYIPTKKEIKDKRFVLPFYKDRSSLLSEGGVVLGSFAEKQRTSNPSRVISSAKSWLVNSSVNREDKILPWNSDEIIGEKRYSPVEILSFLLCHLRLFWNSTIAKHSSEYILENQRLTITIPASFDEVASRLTINAAIKAGFIEEKIRIVEEPQAAFYFWLDEFLERQKLLEKENIDKLRRKLENLFSVNEYLDKKVVVCDIGGGTCDFSLFKLVFNKAVGAQPFKIERIKVSDHILLGGDNIDLKIASIFEGKYRAEHNKALSSQQWAEVVSQAKVVKENILNLIEDPGKGIDNNEFRVAICDNSKNLFSGTVTVAVRTKEIQEIILKDFFPDCSKGMSSNKGDYFREALSELNLPYARNPAFSHHLSEFLNNSQVDAILFVGGTFAAEILRRRICEIISAWQERKLVVLNSKVSAFAVSQGAALYGRSLIDKDNFHIKSGYARSLYLEVNKTTEQGLEQRLICLIPKGYSGSAANFITIEHLDLKLSTNKEVVFNLYYSNSRTKDLVGDVVEMDLISFMPLSPIQTRVNIRNKNYISIYLQIGLTATGLLQVFCVNKMTESIDKPQKWLFEFNVQDTLFSRQNYREILLNDNNQDNQDKNFALEKSHKTIDLYFGKSKSKESDLMQPKSAKIFAEFESFFGSKKQDWDLPTIRFLVGALIANKSRRERSSAHEASWFNLCGYSLRPGYGHQLDQSRLQELWPLFSLGIKNTDTSKVKNEWWVFWRRVAGGLKKDQQNKIFSKIFPQVKDDKASPEMIMAIASLELVDMNKKITLGTKLVNNIVSGSSLYLQAKMWALTRIASRHLLYSGPENILRPVYIEKWFLLLRELAPSRKKQLERFIRRYYISSGRIVGDREFDICATLRNSYLNELKSFSNSSESLEPLNTHVKIEQKDKTSLFGESLPAGLSLI